MRTVTVGAIVEVIAERERQDQQWGGPAHDDLHSPHEWLIYIDKQLESARYQMDLATDSGHMAETRIDARKELFQRLVKVAALAVAAFDSMTRNEQQFMDGLDRAGLE